MDLVDRDEFISDLQNLEFFSENDRRMMNFFLRLLKSRQSVNESSWLRVSYDTPVGSFINYKCEKCHKIVGEIDKVTPHCPSCGRKMTNFKNLK